MNYQYKTIENYLNLCSDESENLKSINIEPSINPKISIISPVYNTGKFVLRLLKSIYYQSFQDYSSSYIISNRIYVTILNYLSYI